jgi:ribonuclease HI
LGTQTNNFAEYTAIIEALSWVLQNQESLGPISEIECRMDSQLACRQLTGVYKVKHPQIKPLFAQVQLLQQSLGVPFYFIHIPREKNTLADTQVNAALDKAMSSSIQ